MKLAMSDKPEASVLGSLPHSRPQRRSDKRAARPEQPAKPGPQQPPKPAAEQRAKRPAKPAAEQPAKPAPEQPEPELRRPSCPSSVGDGAELLGTVVKAGVELAEIGLTVGARALRIAVSRLPKP